MGDSVSSHELLEFQGSPRREGQGASLAAEPAMRRPAFGVLACASGVIAFGAACAEVPRMPRELLTEDDPAASGSAKPSPDDAPLPAERGSTLPAIGGSAPSPASPTCPGARGVIRGPIEAKYWALGGCSSVLGVATSNELATSDGVGRYNTFERGVIVWTPSLGAWEIHGLVHDRWVALGREASVVGYPVGDEQKTPDGIGRYSVFQRGSIYWSPSTGAHEVHGRIRDKYKDLGWEAGSLGYPTSGEYAVAGGRRNDFQRGTLTWTSATDTVTVTVTTP